MTDTTPKEPVIPQDQQIPEYSYTDLHKEHIKDIASNTELPKEEVKPPVETPKVEEVPLEEVGRNIAQETAKKILDEQRAEAERIAQEKKTQEEQNKPQPDEYALWEKSLWDKEKRTPTYKEALEFVTEQAEKRLEAKQLAKTQALEKDQQLKQQQQQEETKRINAFVDDELSELYSSGRLTSIKDANNPSDQGVVERKALFDTWRKVNEKRVSEGKPEIISATRIFHSYYTKPDAQPPGVNAPIAGNRGSTVPPSDEQAYSYAEIHKTPFRNFFRRK